MKSLPLLLAQFGRIMRVSARWFLNREGAEQHVLLPVQSFRASLPTEGDWSPSTQGGQTESCHGAGEMGWFACFLSC